MKNINIKNKWFYKNYETWALGVIFAYLVYEGLYLDISKGMDAANQLKNEVVNWFIPSESGAVEAILRLVVYYLFLPALIPFGIVFILFSEIYQLIMSIAFDKEVYETAEYIGIFFQAFFFFKVYHLSKHQFTAYSNMFVLTCGSLIAAKILYVFLSDSLIFPDYIFLTAMTFALQKSLLVYAEIPRNLIDYINPHRATVGTMWGVLLLGLYVRPHESFSETAWAWYSIFVIPVLVLIVRNYHSYFEHDFDKNTVSDQYIKSLRIVMMVLYGLAIFLVPIPWYFIGIGMLNDLSIDLGFIFELLFISGVLSTLLILWQLLRKGQDKLVILKKITQLAYFPIFIFAFIGGALVKAARPLINKKVTYLVLSAFFTILLWVGVITPLVLIKLIALIVAAIIIFLIAVSWSQWIWQSLKDNFCTDTLCLKKEPWL